MSLELKDLIPPGATVVHSPNWLGSGGLIVRKDLLGPAPLVNGLLDKRYQATAFKDARFEEEFDSIFRYSPDTPFVVMPRDDHYDYLVCEDQLFVSLVLGSLGDVLAGGCWGGMTTAGSLGVATLVKGPFTNEDRSIIYWAQPETLDLLEEAEVDELFA